MKKMKFTIEFEVPEDIEKFFGIELTLSTLDRDEPWHSVYLFNSKKMQVRDGKHLHFDSVDSVGKALRCTVKAVGELSEEEKLYYDNKAKEEQS